jgi:hypothetical protein
LVELDFDKGETTDETLLFSSAEPIADQVRGSLSTDNWFDTRIGGNRHLEDKGWNVRPYIRNRRIFMINHRIFMMNHLFLWSKTIYKRENR